MSLRHKVKKVFIQTTYEHNGGFREDMHLLQLFNGRWKYIRRKIADMEYRSLWLLWWSLLHAQFQCLDTLFQTLVFLVKFFQFSCQLAQGTLRPFSGILSLSASCMRTQHLAIRLGCGPCSREALQLSGEALCIV